MPSCFSAVAMGGCASRASAVLMCRREENLYPTTRYNNSPSFRLLNVWNKSVSGWLSLVWPWFDWFHPTYKKEVSEWHIRLNGAVQMDQVPQRFGPVCKGRSANTIPTHWPSVLCLTKIHFSQLDLAAPHWTVATVFVLGSVTRVRER